MNEPLIDSLRDLKTQSGSNLHDCAIVAITACILEGVDTGPAIVATLGRVGFNPKHVGLTLAQNAGASLSSYHWYRGDDEHYHLHTE